MQDGIIAGNGNSRYLKTVSAALGLYPTYEDFMAALIAGTFPIDLNGINAAGWTQQGTALNKANLLTDATCSALGIATTATPNDALNKLRLLVTDVKNSIVFGTYTGDNAGDDYSSRTISLGFTPRALLLMNDRGATSYHSYNTTYYYGGLVTPDFPITFIGNADKVPYTVLNIVTNGFQVYKGNDSGSYNSINTNASGIKYIYMAFK